MFIDKIPLGEKIIRIKYGLFLYYPELFSIHVEHSSWNVGAVVKFIFIHFHDTVWPAECNRAKLQE